MPRRLRPQPHPLRRAARRLNRTQIPARTRRRSGGRAAVRRRVPRLPLKEKTLVWHLYQAAIAGPRHLLTTSATRTTSRCATCSKRSSRSREAIDRSDARRDRALHQAVLDQHRPVQQPDRAQVRASVHAGRVRRRGARRGARRARVSRCASGETLDALLARLRPMFFDPDVDPMVTSQDAARRQGHPHRERQQPVRRRDDEGPRGVRGAYPLNSRLVKRDGRLVEEVYRVGGRYGAQIAAIVGHLEAAMPFATEPMARRAARA